MQFPSKLADDFILSMNEKSEKIRYIFLESIVNATKSLPIKVMLADATVIEQTTFDPTRVQEYCQHILKMIPGWTTDGISTSKDKDLRRIFIKFHIKEGNYSLSCHMSLQYHALLYYRLDHRVVEIQKELSDIIEKTKSLEANLMQKGDQVVRENLRETGHDNIDEQKLFEILFEDDKLTNELVDKIYSSADKGFHQLTTRKSDLFKELDNMILEIYHTSSVMIDEIRMIGAEEGCLCHFDLEHVKNQTKGGNFDPKRIPLKIKNNLLKRMDDILKAVKF